MTLKKHFLISSLMVLTFSSVYCGHRSEGKLLAPAREYFTEQETTVKEYFRDSNGDCIEDKITEEYDPQKLDLQTGTPLLIRYTQDLSNDGTLEEEWVFVEGKEKWLKGPLNYGARAKKNCE